MTKPNLIEQAKQALEDATPGPWSQPFPLEECQWSLDTCGENSCVFVGKMGSGPIAICAVEAAFGYDDLLDANAALMALAPQMAQALIAAEEVVQAILRTKYWDAVKMEMLAYRKATDMEAE